MFLFNFNLESMPESRVWVQGLGSSPDFILFHFFFLTKRIVISKTKKKTKNKNKTKTKTKTKKKNSKKHKNELHDS